MQHGLYAHLGATGDPSADYWHALIKGGRDHESAQAVLSVLEVPSHEVEPTADPCSTFERCNFLAGKRLKIIGKRERRIVALLVRIHKLQGGDASAVEQQRRHVAGGVRGVICSVFGAHCSEAISVATCESTLRVTARNGDYWGLFQFGSFARAHYGFAWDALTQSRAAYRYWRDAGWSPWQCQP